MPADADRPAEVDAVVLDLGGVICRYDFDLAYAVWSKDSGLDTEEIRTRIRESDLVHPFERGEITPDAFVAGMNRLLGTTYSIETFTRTWNDIFLGYTDGIESLAPRIANRSRLTCLSNTNALHAAHWREACAGVLAHTERIFTSHEIGARKPEPQAYWSVLEYLNLPPWRVAFFDDVATFVAGGRKVGLRAFEVTSTAGIERDLEPLIGPL